MPSLNKTACRCGGTRIDGACDRCGTRRGRHQASTTARGYGSDWARLSKRIRTERPLCQVCQAQGKVTAATEVHHLLPITLSPHLRLEPTNLLSVCRVCHEELERGDSTTPPGSYCGSAKGN